MKKEIRISYLKSKATFNRCRFAERADSQKEFISSSEYVPISNLISGVTSLDALEDNSKYRVELDQLKRSGLNNGDINFYFDSKKGLEYLRLKHKNLDVPHIEQRLEHIHSSLEIHRLKKEDNSDSLSTEKGRQKTEFMLSIKPNSKETNLLKFALDNEKKYNDHIPSALDGIKELEQEINNSLQDIQTPNFSHIRRKVRKMKRRIESIKPEISEPIINNASNSISFVNNSKWDMRVLESQQEQRKINGEKSYS
ncbi:hypothetical protein HHI36_020048 [Cryptolaemus montrouzieri]|uniref:Uncharacterized protein n=1 Tax=Cryptolaemus montrouzieri TaxID=559131 RepID=A0ABD2N919_9CUCU